MRLRRYYRPSPADGAAAATSTPTAFISVNSPAGSFPAGRPTREGGTDSEAPFLGDFYISCNLTSYHDACEENTLRSAVGGERLGYDRWRIGLKGFCLTLGWTLGGGAELAVKRMYGPDGQLLGVLHYEYS